MSPKILQLQRPAIRIYAIIVPILAILLGGCNQCKDPADLSGIDLTLEIDRYERALFELDTADLDGGIAGLDEVFPGYTEFYFQQLLAFSGIWPDSLGPNDSLLKDYLTHETSTEILDSVNAVFPDMSYIQTELEDAYRHLSYYFPNRKLPRVISSTTGMGYSAFTVDAALLDSSEQLLVLGLDLHLGDDFPGYHANYPLYAIDGFSKEYLVPNAVKSIYNDWFIGDIIEQDRSMLIYEMVDAGKQLYFVEQMLPCREGWRIIEYTPEQWLWCGKFEHAIWDFFVERQLLYDDDFVENRRFLGEGPGTTGMPPEAPGNIGAFVGWRIVQQFMEASKGALSLQDLMKLDPKTIVSKARYKPGKPVI